MDRVAGQAGAQPRAFDRRSSLRSASRTRHSPSPSVATHRLPCRSCISRYPAPSSGRGGDGGSAEPPEPRDDVGDPDAAARVFADSPGVAGGDPLEGVRFLDESKHARGWFRRRADRGDRLTRWRMPGARPSQTGISFCHSSPRNRYSAAVADRPDRAVAVFDEVGDRAEASRAAVRWRSVRRAAGERRRRRRTPPRGCRRGRRTVPRRTISAGRRRSARPNGVKRNPSKRSRPASAPIQR